MAKYKKDMPERLFKSMKQGYSFEASVSDLEVCKKTGYRWVDKYPDFANAKKRGEAAALKKLESFALAALSGVIPAELKKLGSKQINITMCIFLLKTRFHSIYGDKLKVEETKKPFIIESNKGDKTLKLGMREK